MSSSISSAKDPTSSLHLHPLLLLSDSALPLGSFAFSSGLESFLAHKKTRQVVQSSTSLPSSFPAPTIFTAQFLPQSLSNLASTSLPYVLAAHARPATLPVLDNEFDASTPCTVARRASLAQGRALLQIWERSFRAAASSTVSGGESAAMAAQEAVSAFAAVASGRGGNGGIDGSDEFGSLARIEGHFAPLFGALCAAFGLSAYEATYLFVLNHVKAVLSAGVRAGVLGPYQAQAALASEELQGWVKACVTREIREGGEGFTVEKAVVRVPTMDLWMGRHELLYSRIFNS